MTEDLNQKLTNSAKKEISEAFLEAVFFELMKCLDNEGREKYAKMMEEGASSDETEAFLKEKINDYDEVIRKASEAFEEKKEE